MKKIVQFLIVLALLLVACTPIFAQSAVDTTGISNSWSGIVSDIVTFIAGYVPTPSWVVLLLTVLLLIEQWLAKTKKVQANSTLQLIISVIDALIKAILNKNKVAEIVEKTKKIADVQPTTQPPTESHS